MQSTPDATSNGNSMIAQSIMPNDLVDGVIGKAVNFDGVSKHFIVNPPASTLRFSTTFSISAWVNSATVDPRYGSIIGRQLGTGNADSWILTISNGLPHLFVSNGNVIGHQIPANQWHFITATKDGATLRMYINGEKTAESIASSSTIQSDYNEVTIGAQANSGVINEFFHGKIDEVRVSASVDSPDWIRMSYRNQMPGSTIIRFR